MQISGEGKIGIALGLLGLGGAGAIMVAPEQLAIGWILIGGAAFGFLLLAYHHFANRDGRYPMIWVDALIVLSAVGLIAGCVLRFSYAPFPGWEPKTEKPVELPPQIQTETGRLVSQAQFAKVAELEGFVGGKDEMDLRQLFDLPNILQKNIDTQIIRIGFIKAGKEKEFLYNNYSDNGTWIAWAKEGYYTTGPTGVQFNTGPKDVHHLVTTTKFQMAQKRLVEFVNSALIPKSIKVEIAGFRTVLSNDTELMTRILDEKMHEDEKYFLRNMDMGTPYYGVIANAFAVRLTHLKPSADRILAAIAASWKISR